MAPNDRTNFTTRIDPTLLQRIDERARAEHRSRNEVITAACYTYVVTDEDDEA